jgi:hypothetical protein
MVPKTAPVEGVGSAFLTGNLSKFNDMSDIGRSQPSQDEITFIDMKTIKPEMTDWLWKDWLAAGELNLIAGTPGTGKTTLALSFAANVSAGNWWPDSTRAPIGNVIIWNGEDDLKKTIVPRLIQVPTGTALCLLKRVNSRMADGGLSAPQPISQRFRKPSRACQAVRRS